MPKIDLDFTKFQEAVRNATPEALRKKGLTLKTMERLPAKDFIKKETIESELKRGDVKKSEREIMEAAIKRINANSDSISREVLGGAIADQLTPLEINMTDKYAGYGVDNIRGYARWFKQRGIAPIDTTTGAYDSNIERFSDRDGLDWDEFLDSQEMAQRTNIWRLPYEVPGASNHFNDRSYFSHTRSYDVGKGAKRTRHLVELQSDLAQRSRLTPEKRGVLNRLLEENTRISEEIARLNRATERTGFLTDEEKMQVKELADGYLSDQNNPFANEMHEEYKKLNHDDLGYVDALEALNERMGVRYSEIQKQLAEPQVNESTERIIPTWHERTLREENREAAKLGLKKMRMAHPDTVEAVEGWPRMSYSKLKAKSLEGKKVQELDPEWGQHYGNTPEDEEAFSKARFTGRILVNPRERGNGDIGLEIELPSGHITHYYVDETILGKLGRDSYLEVKAGGFEDPQLEKEHQGIKDFYSRNVSKFVQKEFGAKEVTDEFGNKWYEWDVKPDARDNPIHYLGPAAAATGVGAAATHSDDSFANEIGTLASIAGNRVPDERAALLRDPVKRIENFVAGTPLPAAGKLAADLSPAGTVTTGLEAVQAAEKGNYLESLGLAGLTGLGLIPGVNAAAKGVKAAIDKVKKLKGK